MQIKNHEEAKTDGEKKRKKKTHSCERERERRERERALCKLFARINKIEKCKYISLKNGRHMGKCYDLLPPS
jgi:hypothetical protein